MSLFQVQGLVKRFGGLPQPGLLSFARPGFTLTLDFANQGGKTLLQRVKVTESGDDVLRTTLHKRDRVVDSILCFALAGSQNAFGGQTGTLAHQRVSR